jgi:hypothetical protein
MKTAAFAIVLGLACAAVFADPVGEIVFLDGRVELMRDEQTLTEKDLDTGAPIENLDRIRTGDNGQVIISITAENGAPADVRIAPRTTFYVEIAELGGRSTTTLGMMTGSIGLKVQKLSGNRDLNVRTETTTMGVRGTTFDVTSSPAGDVLVTTQEGSVACTDEDKGGELLAQPGQAVERRADEDTFNSIPVAVSNLERFQREWLAERIEVFRSGALRATRAYAVRYERLTGEFNEAYAELMRNADVLSKWVAEDRQGRAGSRLEVMREKRAVVGALFKLRKTLFIFERVYYRLVEIEGYYNQGFGRGDIRPGLSAAQFWARFDTDRSDLAAKMARVRHVIRMYAARNDGEFPGEQ